MAHCYAYEHKRIKREEKNNAQIKENINKYAKGWG